jgi:hypothetical protein
MSSAAYGRKTLTRFENMIPRKVTPSVGDVDHACMSNIEVIVNDIMKSISTDNIDIMLTVYRAVIGHLQHDIVKRLILPYTRLQPCISWGLVCVNTNTQIPGNKDNDNDGNDDNDDHTYVIVPLLPVWMYSSAMIARQHVTSDDPNDIINPPLLQFTPSSVKSIPDSAIIRSDTLQVVYRVEHPNRSKLIVPWIPVTISSRWIDDFRRQSAIRNNECCDTEKQPCYRLLDEGNSKSFQMILSADRGDDVVMGDSMVKWNKANILSINVPIFRPDCECFRIMCDYFIDNGICDPIANMVSSSSSTTTPTTTTDGDMIDDNVNVNAVASATSSKSAVVTAMTTLGSGFDIPSCMINRALAVRKSTIPPLL